MDGNENPDEIDGGGGEKGSKIAQELRRRVVSAILKNPYVLAILAAVFIIVIIFSVIGLGLMAQSSNLGSTPVQQAEASSITQLLAMARDEDSVTKIIQDKVKKDKFLSVVNKVKEEINSAKSNTEVNKNRVEISNKQIDIISNALEQLGDATKFPPGSQKFSDKIKEIIKAAGEIKKNWTPVRCSPDWEFCLPLVAEPGFGRRHPHGRSYGVQGYKGKIIGGRFFTNPYGSEGELVDPIDLSVKAGTAVYAPISGKATAHPAGYDSHVLINNKEGGHFAVLGHIDPNFTGEKTVVVGEKVGTIRKGGINPRSKKFSGAHLHFELRLNGKNIHGPAPYQNEKAIWKVAVKALLKR
ncbi:MAG: hypothetical protein CEN88_439 [Candidatus Berkelbacteria bacterium Licking1014_2]|uniref:M23ase beta-sheet core domain-containing protein n=1 Tax=Candidatus Berkelbacteria bacterium Licking1014_2 TaxID=2017146 RepID=A0A554LS98_9BACT|nr:MAG: hypothetical protein CEN88_439 [Candidatus Berkelbacteria bacterium Licking1014_2]